MASVFVARLLSVPKHVRGEVLRRMPVGSIEEDPSSPIAWIATAQAMLGNLPPRTRALIDNHDLEPRQRKLSFFAGDIRKGAGPSLARLSKLPLTSETVAQAIDQIVKWKEISVSAYAHRAGQYFDDAEAVINRQWNTTIWPIIAHCDFSHVLDLACGHGRNSEKLRARASSIDLVDINKSCIDTCRRRFGQQIGNCLFRYHVNNGASLSALSDASISLVYCWDSMVHFDRLLVRDYIEEIARVLAPGGRAFLHHSNLGTKAPESDHLKNHGSRSNMSAEVMRDYADKVGLAVEFQRLSGRADGWGIDELDCLSLLQKPA